jgi:hypothetical protein
LWRAVDASTGERDDCDFTAGPPSWLFRVVLLPESALVLAGFKMPLLVIAIFNNYEMTLALVRKIIQTPVLSIALALTPAKRMDGTPRTRRSLPDPRQTRKPGSPSRAGHRPRQKAGAAIACKMG